MQKGTYLYVMRPWPVGAEASTLLQASPLLFQKGFIPTQFVLSAIPNILGKWLVIFNIIDFPLYFTS